MNRQLDKINTPSDLKKLNNQELSSLCEEIRELLINTVSKNGGHLAGNLGVVELTVALHKVLNAPKDKIVWDVGHQSYVHKILTGRGELLSTIRQMGGLSGFCNPLESDYDTVFTGHASTSLSTAAGIAQARNLSGEDYNVVAVIGDGALTGGLAYEAINNIGNLKSKMLIVLNDNEMSIAENVGALSALLSKARTNRRYTASKRKLVEKLSNMPHAGDKIMKKLRKFKQHIKSAVSSNMMFEQLGITYLGPVNGHNIGDMVGMFQRALALDEPVLVHVITKKGKGYSPAEKNPEIYHGVGPFEKASGNIIKKQDSFSSVFGEKLCELAANNKKIVAITPAMIPGSGLIPFMRKFPDRLYDVGIAEGHAVTFSGGIAVGGGLPVVSVYSTFLQRAYDNMIHDVALGNYHVVFAVDRAGLVAGDGVTHQGLFDISYLTTIPNMTLLSPSSYGELEKMMEYAVCIHRGPIAIRFPRGREKCSVSCGEFVVSKASIINPGTDLTIVAEGQSVGLALRAAKLLKERNISAEVIDVRTIKPMDFDTIFGSVCKTKALYTLEENLKRGGMGEMIACEAKIRKYNFKLKIKAIDDEFVTHGSIDTLNEKYGYTPENIASDIERMLES